MPSHQTIFFVQWSDLWGVEAIAARYIGVPIIIVGFIQGTDGKYRFVIGVPIIIVGFIQGTDGKYRFVIGVPIAIVGFIQGTDGKYRFVIGVPSPCPPAPPTPSQEPVFEAGNAPSKSNAAAISSAVAL